MLVVLRDGAKSCRASARDISETGCFVEADDDANLPSTHTLAILSPSGTWVEMPASVVRNASGKGFGIKFEALSETERIALQYLVEYAEVSDDATG